MLVDELDTRTDVADIDVDEAVVDVMLRDSTL